MSDAAADTRTNRRADFAARTAADFAGFARRALADAEAELSVALILAAARRRVGAGAAPLDPALDAVLVQALPEVRLDRLVARHAGRALDVAWSPDGALTASVGAEGEAKVCEVGASDVGVSVRAHEGRIVAAAFDPVRPRLLTAGEDGAARLIDVVEARVSAELNGHVGTLLAAAFSSDGRWVVTAADAWSVRLWSAETGEAGADLAGHDGLAVYAAAFAPDGLRLATGGDDGSARIWRTSDGAGLKALAHAGPVRDLAWSDDGLRVATASYDGFFRVWRARDGKLEHLTPSPAARPKFVVALSEDDWLFVDEAGGARRASRNAEDPFALHDRAMMRRCDGVRFADRAVLAAAGADGVVSVWETRDRKDAPPKLLLRKKVCEGPVHAAALSPDARALATADAAGRVLLWSIDPLRALAGASVGPASARLAAARAWALRADRAFTALERERYDLDDDETRPWIAPVEG